jgi:16S rRNA (adenine1518-N6/adenine1519-N6)-dimethyltransferase
MKYSNFSKKSLGQNFLIDQNIINKIANIAEVKGKIILEIGPGYGSLTKKILSMDPKKVYAIEKDRDLFLFLKDFFKSKKNIQIINEDILNIIKNKKISQCQTVLGNLPYNISTQILAALILTDKWPPNFNTLVFMFQKEVADRIVAKSGSKTFGRLSILCNWRFNVTKHFDVSRNCFKPKPKIKSTVLSFSPKKNSFFLKNPKTLEMITRVLFSNRRKKVNKNFAKLFHENEIVARELGLNLNNRPEQLSSEMFYKIAIKYEKLLS